MQAEPLKRTVGVIGKAPVPGTVKSRLVPPLDPARAAMLYRAFLRDTLTLAVSIDGASVSLVHPPVADRQMLEELVPEHVTCIEQSGMGLGDAMRGAVEDLVALGASTVVLIGSDLPTLPPSHIEAAFAALERDDTDVVLGPAADGGYYLIGLRAPQPALFESIDWSTNRVLAQTLDRARSVGLRVALIERWHDVDNPDDLLRLARELADDPDVASATREALASLWTDGPDHGPAMHRCARYAQMDQSWTQDVDRHVDDTASEQRVEVER